MGNRFMDIAFTDSVRAAQVSHGSREAYAKAQKGEVGNHRLSLRETAFLQARDSFYMASVSETGWPYVQHRGGSPGFVRVLGESTIGFADFRGNRQYVSVGNLTADDRVSLFFMDYPNRKRLKMLGRARFVGRDDPDLLAQLVVDGYRATVERGLAIEVEAFDWNCPQHITPRFTESEFRALLPDQEV